MPEFGGPRRAKQKCMMRRKAAKRPPFTQRSGSELPYELASGYELTAHSHGFGHEGKVEEKIRKCMEIVNICGFFLFKKLILLKMGVETQLSMLMGVNHSKLFKSSHLFNIEVTMQFRKAGSGSALRNSAGSGSAKK